MNANSPPPDKNALQVARDAVWEAMARNERVCFEMGYDQGFNAGWDAAVRRFTAVMDQKPPDPEPPDPSKVRLPGAKAPAVTGEADTSSKTKVLAAIRENPGLRGVELVEAVGLNERTVRTALHRLKTAEQIRVEDGKWYANEVPALTERE